MRRFILVSALLVASAPAFADVSCSPVDTTARILRSPSPNDIHPDWTGENYVGTSWTFVSGGRTIENDTGEYLRGTLISPRGGEVNRGVYIVTDEWECE